MALSTELAKRIELDLAERLTFDGWDGNPYHPSDILVLRADQHSPHVSERDRKERTLAIVRVPWSSLHESTYFDEGPGLESDLLEEDYRATWIEDTPGEPRASYSATYHVAGLRLTGHALELHCLISGLVVRALPGESES